MLVFRRGRSARRRAYHFISAHATGLLTTAAGGKMFPGEPAAGNTVPPTDLPAASFILIPTILV